MDEIDQLFSNEPIIRRNRRSRSALYAADGYACGGRRLRVNFNYIADTRSAVLISAWEL